MKISIALGTYNGACFLQAQLDSFVAQTRRPDELVATDDGSTDNTIGILESFAATAPFKVSVRRNERNFGYGGNFNQALLRTRGDLVFLSDQDDVWFPHKIERIAAIAAQDLRALVFMNDAALTDADLRDTGLTKLGQIHSAGFNESNFVMGCCAAVKRDLLDLCLPMPEECFEHDIWIVGIADRMGRKRIVPEVLQYYRRHNDNESQWIVNRTTRVTRWHVRAERWRLLFRGLLRRDAGKPTQGPTTSPAHALMQQWAQVTARHAPEPYASDLLAYLAHIEKQERGQARRSEIRGQAFPQRMGSVACFWRDGGYQAFSGVKSALRDLMG